MSDREATRIPVSRVLLPENAPIQELFGFDYGDALYHVFLFDFGDDGGAVGIRRDDEPFCARISLNALAEFNLQLCATHMEGRA